MKLLSGKYFENTGLSIVKLSDKYGEYIGYAQLHEDDRKFASKFTGCYIAERRAEIEALKNKIRRQKQMLKAVKNLKKDIETNVSIVDPSIIRRINLKIRDYNNEINYAKEEIDFIKINMQEYFKLKEKIKRSKEIKKNK